MVSAIDYYLWFLPLLPFEGRKKICHNSLLLKLKSKILRVDCCIEFVARIQVSYKLQNTKMNKYFNDSFLDPAICQLLKATPKVVTKK